MSAVLPAQTQVTTPAGPPKRPFVLSAIWLGVWVVLAAWAALALGTAWPYVQLMPQWLLLVALPGLAFRAFDVVTMRMLRRRVRGWRRLVARLGAIVVGVPAAAASWEGLDAISMARFERAMTPLVARLQSDRGAICLPTAPVAVDLELAAYLEDANAPRAPAELHFDKQRFVLTLPGRSMDIDGSSMFYDSRGRQWRKVHNDALSSTGELTALTAGLSVCRFTLR